MTPVAIFFIQSLLVVSLPYAAWRFGGLRRVMPLVVIQIVLGVLVGPSVLGHLAPDVWQLMFSTASLNGLSGTAWLAVVLFAFLTGLHLQPQEIRQLGGSFAVVTLASVLVPAVVGMGLGWGLIVWYPEALGEDLSKWHFIIAIGLLCSVTALPVLGSILRESGLIAHRLGRYALGVAAISDALLWISLALLLVNLPRPHVSFISAGWMPVLGLVYMGIMFFAVQPLLARFIKNGDGFQESGLVLVCTTIFASALVAELVGLHSTLGGFIAGVIIPRAAARVIIERLEPLTVVVLLPFFFTLVGMSITVDASSSNLLEISLLAIGLSMLGKIGGTAMAARWSGESWKCSLALGVLLQTKGMMEVVVLSVLKEAGVISPMIFSAMLFMALITTAATTPLLRWIGGKDAPWDPKTTAY
ncbi:MAG: cation:proton antiporter [Magnetococcales bacterium]|nr:cation:proton antiporter [Magnetococcales bacterium]NGZ26512.1 cation:proton antiporter [Magnetococcales bacterium]